jgi:hypothetical protein
MHPINPCWCCRCCCCCCTTKEVVKVFIDISNEGDERLRLGLLVLLLR